VKIISRKLIAHQRRKAIVPSKVGGRTPTLGGGNEIGPIQFSDHNLVTESITMKGDGRRNSKVFPGTEVEGDLPLFTEDIFFLTHFH
jgi:hypothetical protein